MSTKAYGITSGGVIKCSRVALIPASRGMRSTAGWALFHCVESGWHLVRELSDEIQSESRMREIRTSGLMSGERKRATASRPRTAPFLDSTRGGAHRRGLATYYVLFFLHLETRRVTVAGITQHPTEEW